jgi:rubrerythrin
MAIRFNADEILGIAVGIEQNGQKFYRRAAQIVKKAELGKVLLELADWEAGHERLFADMRAQLTDDERTSTAFDPDDESGLFLQAVADGHVFVANKDAAALLKGKEGAGEIFRIALDFERDSILFFLGMKDMVPVRLGADKVDGVVKEEMRHVGYLQKQLAGLGRK